jgi:hypothetical protein
LGACPQNDKQLLDCHAEKAARNDDTATTNIKTPVGQSLTGVFIKIGIPKEAHKDTSHQGNDVDKVD